MARPAVIDSAAPNVIAVSPENLRKLVIVVSSLLRLIAFGCLDDTTGSNPRM
jgi:hypothetical protein